MDASRFRLPRNTNNYVGKTNSKGSRYFYKLKILFKAYGQPDIYLGVTPANGVRSHTWVCDDDWSDCRF